MNTDIFNFLRAKNMRTRHMVGKTGEEKRAGISPHAPLGTPHFPRHQSGFCCCATTLTKSGWGGNG